MRLKPILKWPGGKRWLTSQVAPVLTNELTGTYFEPFVGGGAMFLALQPEVAVLSDSNPDLIAFYQACIANPAAVVAAAQRNSNCEDDYYFVRNSSPRTAVTKAARFLYLNRTCWGGIYRLNKAGEFNVPFGDNGRRICSRASIVEASKTFESASFLCSDFETMFTKAERGDVIFADPPYTSKGQFNGFVRYNERLFSWDDQRRLSRAAKAARSRGVFVSVCGSYHRDILGLYQNWWVLPLERESRVANDVNARRRVYECLIVSRRPKHKKSNLYRITDAHIAKVPQYSD